MKKSKYKVLNSLGEQILEIECEFLVANDLGIIAFNQTTVEPVQQQVVFATKSTDVMVLRVSEIIKPTTQA